jgi:hypothetical protein
VYSLQNWSEETTKSLRKAYAAKRSSVWRQVAEDMNFEGDWSVFEKKAFEIGLKESK